MTNSESPNADDVLALLAGGPPRWSAGAISYRLRCTVGGFLGDEPPSQVASVLEDLERRGRVSRAAMCPVCEIAGNLYQLADEVEELDEEQRVLAPHELAEAMRPLVEEGLVELSENVEFVERACCARTTRLWREAPRPS
jgi:hypothetical protein